MRSTVTLMVGLSRDPALALASLVLVFGLAMVAIMSFVVTRRVRWPAGTRRFDPFGETAFDSLPQPAA